MQRLRGFSILALSLWLFGCGDTISEEFYFIPSVQMQCATGIGDACTNSSLGQKVFVGVMDVSSKTCREIMYGIDEQALKSTFIVTTTSTTDSDLYGDTVTAVAEGWVNAKSTRVYMLDPREYRVCAFIDENGDNELNESEPIGTGKLTAGVAGPRMSKWEKP